MELVQVVETDLIKNFKGLYGMNFLSIEINRRNFYGGCLGFFKGYEVDVMKNGSYAYIVH